MILHIRETSVMNALVCQIEENMPMLTTVAEVYRTAFEVAAEEIAGICWMDLAKEVKKLKKDSSDTTTRSLVISDNSFDVLSSSFVKETGMKRINRPYLSQLVLFYYLKKVGKKAENCSGKAISFAADDIVLFQFAEAHIVQQENGKYIFSEKPVRNKISYKQVLFDVNHSYEVFDKIGNSWGGWNSCPNHDIMMGIAKKWQELYSAELTAISHDTLHFSCRKLSKSEAENLMSEILEEIAPDTLECYDGKKEKLEKSILENQEYTLWWD